MPVRSASRLIMSSLITAKPPLCGRRLLFKPVRESLVKRLWDDREANEGLSRASGLTSLARTIDHRRWDDSRETTDLEYFIQNSGKAIINHPSSPAHRRTFWDLC